jgi:hypothetical protein
MNAVSNVYIVTNSTSAKLDPGVRIPLPPPPPPPHVMLFDSPGVLLLNLTMWSRNIYSILCAYFIGTLMISV